jgi:hypothetical protein
VVLLEISEGKRLRGRRRHRWDVTIEMHVKEINGRHRSHPAKDPKNWRGLLSTAMKYGVP